MERSERFAELFRAEHAGLVQELTLVVGDRALAEDLAADAFVELWRRWRGVSGYDRPGAWLRRVALHKAGRARWRRGRRPAVEATHVVCDGAGPVDLDLLDALRQLSHAQRTAVVMHHLGGWAAADIATVLGCAEVTVRTHLHRGRQRLAALLDDPAPTTEASDVEPR